MISTTFASIFVAGMLLFVFGVTNNTIAIAVMAVGGLGVFFTGVYAGKEARE